MNNLFSTALGYLLSIALLGTPSLSAHASEKINIARCVSQISTHSVRVAQAVANTSRAESALEEAKEPRLPQLVAQGDLADSDNEVTLANDANKAVIRIEQGTLPFGSAWKLGNQRALELQAAKLSKIETIQDVQLLVKQLYFSILRDQDTITNLNTVETEFKRLLNNVIPRFQIGRAPSFDLVKAKSSIYDLTRARELLRSQLLAERTELAQIVGLQGEQWQLQPISKLPEIPTTISREQVLSYNPSLQVLSKQVEASESAIGVAEAERLPSLSAAGEYGFAGQTPSTVLLSWTGYAQLRLTIFDWGLISSQVDQARADAVLAHKKLEAKRQKVNTELVREQALAQAHLADVKRLKALMPELKRSADVSVNRYRKGAMGIIEATDAVSLWLQDLNNERSAYYDYLSDVASIERLAGGTIHVAYSD